MKITSTKKITADRKADILRRKEEYEADKAQRQARYDYQYKRFRDATRAVFEPVESYLTELLSQYSALTFNVRVDEGRFGVPGLAVRIDCNENNKFDSNSALSWDYEASMTKDGEILRETSSWSGLKAVTAEQMESLKQTVAALEKLNSLDWNNLLNRMLPEYSEYVTEDDPRYDINKPNFDQELLEAEIEDIIGKRKMIAVQHFESSWYRANVYVAIVRDSGSQYTIIECPMHGSYNPTEYFDAGQTHRVRKTSIKPLTPLQVIDV